MAKKFTLVLEDNMTSKKISCTVAGKYNFEVIATERKTPEDQTIPANFYTDAKVAVPPGVHWELQLTEVPDEAYSSEKPLHIYVPPESDLAFVCYIRPIPDLEEAANIFRNWCAGSVYTIENGQDFAELEQEPGESWEDTVSRVAGINITASVSAFD